MLPDEVTGCDGHPSAQRQRKMAESLTGFLLQEIFREDFAEGGMTESGQAKAEASRRMREKRFELQRIFGTDQYDAGGHRQARPDGRGAGR